jgi:D-serine deaminase-like pyridoxal phosphate-dependent protein
MAKTLETLETPCLVLDADRLEQNVARMRAKIGALGAVLRPHVKTAKNIEVTRLALGGDTDAGKITVSTLKEADFFFSFGIRDILYAVGITPNKLDHALRLRRAGADLTLILDNVEAARFVTQKGTIAGERFPVLLEMLTTVLGHQPEKGWIINDAGWMALSRDRGTARQKVDQGYGKVCDIDGNPIENLNVLDTNQEHGIIGDRSDHSPDLSKFPVGTMLRILPNHACATAAQHSCYHVVRKGLVVEAIWERFNGW